MSLPGRLSLGAAHRSGDGTGQVRRTQIVRTARSMGASSQSPRSESVSQASIGSGSAPSAKGPAVSELSSAFVERDTSQMSAEELRAYNKAKKKAAKEERKRRAAEKKRLQQSGANPKTSAGSSSSKNRNKKAVDSTGSPSQKSSSSLKSGGASAKQSSGQFRRKSSTVLPQFDDPSIRKQMKRQAVIKRIPVENSKRIGMFSHLPQFEREFFLSDAAKEIHPAVIRLGYYFCDDVITGANARCIGMLNAFKQVIRDYRPAKHVDLKHDLLSKVNPCIQFLNDCRPLSISMRNAIRWFKSFINTVTQQYYASLEPHSSHCHSHSHSSSKSMRLGIKQSSSEVSMNGGIRSSSKKQGSTEQMTEQDVRRKICKRIDEFIHTKIELADTEIAANVCLRITDGDTILTHAHSFVIEKSLIDAHRQGKHFSVIIVDSRPLMEGRRLLEKLVKCGLHCTYTLISGLSYTLSSNGVSKVFLGASSVLSNGYILSRVGTGMIALMASQSYKIPVTVCCETYKFSERVQIDSICANEIGDADAITKPGLGSFNSSKRELDEWRSMNGLKVVNLKYDITPPHFVTMVITECGAIPPTSAPVIIREFHRDREFV